MYMYIYVFILYRNLQDQTLTQTIVNDIGEFSKLEEL